MYHTGLHYVADEHTWDQLFFCLKSGVRRCYEETTNSPACVADFFSYQHQCSPPPTMVRDTNILTSNS